MSTIFTIYTVKLNEMHVTYRTMNKLKISSIHTSKTYFAVSYLPQPSEQILNIFSQRWFNNSTSKDSISHQF